MKIKIEARAECGYVGADRREIMALEIEDGLTDDEVEELLDEEVRCWFFEYNSYSWKRLDK